MQNSWRKLEDENGFPYYINEKTKQRQWDHPKFVDIKHMIDDCNYVKYSKYRVALKFRVLQRALCMEEISLSTITGVFEKHRLGTNESSLCLESYDLEAVLSDIYFAANKQNHTNIDVDLAVELMQNFLYNVYDKEREGKIQVSSTKLILAVLSNYELPQFYNFLCTLCADHNNCVTRLRFQSMLLKLVDISVFLHEDVCFGQHLISSTTESCFSNSPGLVGLSESNFITWLEDSPHLLSWIPILHKLRNSEFVVHASKCSTCKISPLMGLRYRCTKCSKYTQCQRCFLTGRTNNSHKLSHAMREYCTEGNPREFTFNFIKKICGLMPCSVKLNETSNTVVETKPIRSEKEYLLKPLPAEDVDSCIEPFFSPHAQLQLIIKQLENQNRELQRILLIGNHNEKEIRKYLEEHKSQVAAQINKLKILKDYLDVAPQVGSKNALESTPMMGMSKCQKPRDFQLFSPILHHINETNDMKPENITRESMPYSVNDISTWIKEQPTNSKNEINVDQVDSPVREFHNDLDDALAKLQQILANNFTLDESLGSIDNNHLKNAVSEVEGMLTSFIDTVENSRASSVQPFNQQETDCLTSQ